jgi:hypothetical protein
VCGPLFTNSKVLFGYFLAMEDYRITALKVLVAYNCLISRGYQILNVFSSIGSGKLRRKHQSLLGLWLVTTQRLNRLDGSGRRLKFEFIVPARADF